MTDNCLITKHLDHALTKVFCIKMDIMNINYPLLCRRHFSSFQYIAAGVSEITGTITEEVGDEITNETVEYNTYNIGILLAHRCRLSVCTINT